MKTKLLFIYLLLLLIKTTIQAPRKLGQRRRHHKKIRHHRKHPHHRRHLKRKIYNSDMEKQLSELNEATKLGFEQGLKYAKSMKKRKLNYHDNKQKFDEYYNDYYYGDDEHDQEQEDEHHYHRTMGAVGAAAFLGGTVSRHRKHSRGKAIQHVMKEQFAFKDSIINIVTKEIQDLHFLNQKLGSAGRRIGSTENNIMQRLQEKVFELYNSRNH